MCLGLLEVPSPRREGGVGCVGVFAMHMRGEKSPIRWPSVKLIYAA